MNAGDFPPEVKRPVRELDQSLQFNEEVERVDL
jgi:hypothetical protein